MARGGKYSHAKLDGLATSPDVRTLAFGPNRVNGHLAACSGQYVASLDIDDGAGRVVLHACHYRGSEHGGQVWVL